MNLSDEEKLSTKERITKATLDVIADVGFDKVTVRKIAAKANVNIALISYYFQSKEQAVFHAISDLGGEFQSCFGVLTEQTLPPDQRIRSLFQRYADVAHKHPYVMRSLIVKSDKFQEFKLYHFLREDGFGRFVSVIKEIHPVDDEKALFIKFFQAMSAIAFPTLLAENMEPMSGIAYNNQADRYKYIDILVSNFM